MASNHKIHIDIEKASTPTTLCEVFSVKAVDTIGELDSAVQGAVSQTRRSIPDALLLDIADAP